ncbi:hypothetical protein [Streptomyces rhizosphaerihabitans]|uniref:hypothetical protein n=1 Tax=Streptomyces rhizosphaerihabitans TaxID=1266770 RepID=UPI0021BEAF11|nr:hypothetical protein [Streptomyces rhizosphaerihabitans]MCT9010023.1 hypothetical protein [Streptomyces rhizosphaerihabitans]
MTVADLEALRAAYLTALDAYTSTAEKARAELGEVRPIGEGPVPTISPAWIQAMEAEHEAQAVYEAARDAYWKAVKAE